MFSKQTHSNRFKAQELAYNAMESGDVHQITKYCQQALEIYPDCSDAIGLLADVEPMMLKDYVAAKRRAVEAGRRDLGERYIEQNKGHFWGDIDTRPYMRALASLAEALLEWGMPEHVDEAIGIYEQMLELNPNDNQGVRDLLHACYLQCKRYEDAARLNDRYPNDWTAISHWGRVLLAFVIGDENQALTLLEDAHRQNQHVAQYLTGQKRLPRTLPDMYSPGQDTEAVYCADALWEAWKKHPKVRQWLKKQSLAVKPEKTTLRLSDDSPDYLATGQPDSQHHDHDESSIQANPLPFPSQADAPLTIMNIRDDIPAAYRERFDELVERTDTFCDQYLNEEYRRMAQLMAAAICQEGSPVLKGKPDGWAAGLIYSLGRVNFLTDPGQVPHMKADAIAKGIGVSPATMQAKARIIREGLDLLPFDPHWTLPSRMHDNPLVWMIEVNGMVLDIRTAPREAQVAAYEKGLIPYIYADHEES